MTDFDHSNHKNSSILVIFLFMSNSMLSLVQHEKSFITLGPDRGTFSEDYGVFLLNFA